MLQYPYSSILLLKKAQLFFEMKQIDASLENLEKAEIFDSNELGIYLLRVLLFFNPNTKKQFLF